MIRDTVVPAVIPLLASASEPPPGTGEWLKVALYIIGCVVLILTAVDRWRAIFGRKPPVDTDLRKIWDKLGIVEKELAGVTVASMTILREHLQGIDERRSAAIREVHGVMDRELTAVHEKVNQTALHLERVASKTETLWETHGQALAALDAKMTRVLERLPRRNS